MPLCKSLPAYSSDVASRMCRRSRETSGLLQGLGHAREPDLSLLDPDVVFEDDILPDHAGESYRGHEGVIRSIRTWVEAYEELTIELGRSSGWATA
jgi:hypothetical protein